MAIKSIKSFFSIFVKSTCPHYEYTSDSSGQVVNYISKQYLDSQVLSALRDEDLCAGERATKQNEATEEAIVT